MLKYLYSYDCMYMNAPNQFYTDGDGGYINVRNPWHFLLMRRVNQ